MANHGLVGSITLKSGEVYPTALVRIVEYLCQSSDIVNTNTWCVRANIYRSAASYDNGDGPAEEPGGNYAIDSNFTTYFAKSVLDDAGKDPYTASYLFLKNEVARYAGFTPV